MSINKYVGWRNNVRRSSFYYFFMTKRNKSHLKLINKAEEVINKLELNAFIIA